MNILTRPAIGAIEDALRREGKAGGGVRISVTGGCSGPKYEMTIETDPGPDDTVIEIREVKLFVAADNMEALVGVTVDYAQGGDGSGFIFESPEGGVGTSASAQGCGCGKSCSTAPSR